MTATFHLEALGTRYHVFVDPPASTTRGDAGPWPVLLCLDGDNFFDPLRAARDAVVDLPPLLLVGLGYGVGIGRKGNRRSRDYSPSALAEEPDSGGGDAFLGMIAEQLWPELGRRYPLHPTSRGIVGHSLSALIGLHAVFQPRPFFSHVLASAPSVWWDDRAVLRRLAAVQATGESVPARVFLGVGLADSHSMIGDLDLLERQLDARPVPHLETVCARFPDRNHFDVLPEAFRAGLAALYGTSAR